MSVSESHPLELLSLHFQYPGSPAIPLRDPETEELLGARPEWIRGKRSEPAAYVRGTLPVVRATFFVRTSSAQAPPRMRLCILGEQGQLAEVAQFTPAQSTSYVSPPLTLMLAQPLPDRIGRHTLKLNWFVLWEGEEGNPCQASLGTTTHDVCTTWKRMTPRSEEQLSEWAYTPLMLWASEWCAGAEDEKAICDAIIRGLPRSGLRYGLPNWSVREMLLDGGGLCGGFYLLFQQLAHCQGVHVERRLALLKYGEEWPPGEFPSVAMVSSRPGVGNAYPLQQASAIGQFNDCREVFPPQVLSELCSSVSQRYTFCVSKSVKLNGHAINFLRYRGGLYVYDASFLLGGIQVDMELPPERGRVAGNQQRSFLLQYLARVWSLLGSMTVQGVRFEANDQTCQPSGVTVSAYLLPGVSFFWRH
ncbi:MAG: hypothetical protein JXB05_07440 [Myxococcaceae bacterium]|nr:hypothetical protein [Myxococcaceae bacterium]